jgi:hypothetical protein
MQEKRKKLPEELMAKSVFQKISMMGGSIPKAYVTPTVYAVDFDTQQKFVSEIYAYYFDGTNITDVVTLRDSRNGKDVGEFNPQMGGLKMK